MKKLVLALVALAVIAPSSFALDAPPITIRNAEFYNVNDTSNADVSIKAAVSGSAHRILKIGVSLLTADTVTFKCGSTVMLGPLYFGATSGLTEEMIKVDFKCADNEVFQATKGDANTSMTFFGLSREE